MCEVLEVSRSGFYAWRSRPESQRSKYHRELLREIRTIHADRNMQSYGSPRVHRELLARGKTCSENTVAALMRRHGLAARTRKRYKVTTDSKHKRPVAANLIQRNFSVQKPNRLWTSDITYIRTQEGWLYLAVFLDAYSRRIVGWSMNHLLNDQLIVNAFKQAQHHRQPAPGLIVHSDRGTQYCSRSFKELLNLHRCQQSMSSTGNCYDNAITESFFATLKTELVYDERYRTRNEAKRSIFKYIEIFYNRSRIHSSIGGLSPDQFEQINEAY